MTTATTASQPSVGLTALFAGILRSEARKLGTVRSTFWIPLAAIGFNVVTAALPTRTACGGSRICSPRACRSSAGGSA
jgi:hypothetical protein